MSKRLGETPTLVVAAEDFDEATVRAAGARVRKALKEVGAVASSA